MSLLSILNTKDVKDYFMVGVKATITGLISIVTVGLIAAAIISLLGIKFVAPILTGAVPLIAPTVLDTIWNISEVAVMLAAMVAILIVSIPMYIFAWGFYGQNIFGFVKGQRGIIGYVNVGIRDLLCNAVGSIALALIGVFAPVTGGLAGIIAFLVHLSVYGFVAVNFMGFRRH